MDASILSGDPFEDELRIRRPDGECRAVPLRDARGKIVKWYGAATDIHDRKRAEQLQTDLARPNRVNMLGELAASISHELKQPIAAGMANAQASLRWRNNEQPDLDQARRATAGIVDDELWAANIINRLQSLYKKDSPSPGVDRFRRTHRRNGPAVTASGQRPRRFDLYKPSGRSSPVWIEKLAVKRKTANDTSLTLRLQEAKE